MKKAICMIAALAVVCGSAYAQRKFEYRVKAGFNVGGTLPIPFPAEIRKIKSFSPTMAFSIEGNILRHFSEQWALLSGLRLETKGMSTKAQVKNYSMTMNVNSGDEHGLISGRFTGSVDTKVQNEYLTIPVLVMRQLSKRWDLKAGLFFSYLIDGGFSGSAYDGYMRDGDPTGTKIGVESATYNFGKDIRRFNWGGELGAEFAAYRHLSVYADLTLAANSIFKKDFKSISFDMYNLYLNIGFGYVF